MKLNENIRYLRKKFGMSQEELAKKTGYTDRSSIARIEKGEIDLPQSKILLFAKAFNISSNELFGDVSDGAIFSNTIHLLGRVAAGSPIFAEENIIGQLDVPLEWSNNQEYYGLLIKGNSMEPQIKNKDIVIVHRQDTADPGDIVIATINGDDAVCKKFMIYGNTVLLRSFNPDYDDIDVTGHTDFKIWGRVIEARHRF